MKSEYKKDMKKTYLVLQEVLPEKEDIHKALQEKEDLHEALQEKEDIQEGLQEALPEKKEGRDYSSDKAEGGQDYGCTGMAVSGLSTEFYLKMMINNNIPGLLEFELRVINNQNHYYYDVTGLQTLDAKAGQGNFTHEQLREILGQMLNIIEEGKEYFLKEEDYIIGEHYMYWSEARKKLWLCYYPGYQADIQEQIRDFTVFLMNHINYREEAAVMMVYGFNKISTQEDCSFEKLKEVLEPKAEKKEAARENIIKNKEIIKAQLEQNIKIKKKEQEKRELAKKEEKKRVIQVCLSFTGLFLVLLAGLFLYYNVTKGGTGSGLGILEAGFWGLGAAACIIWIVIEIRKFKNFIKSCAYYCLVAQDPETEGEEEFWITELPCYIGKSADKNRIVIYNQAVSRHHARIDKEEGQFFVTDLHSTNGTYLNNLRIPPEQRMPLNDRDEICFADAAYSFQMKSLCVTPH